MREDCDRLHKVLEEWQPRAELSAGFDAGLRRRIALAAARPRPWFATAWTRLAAAGALAAALGFVVYLGQNQPQPLPPEVTQAAVVRDLQLLNRNADLIEHLDFLTKPNPPAGEEN